VPDHLDGWHLSPELSPELLPLSNYLVEEIKEIPTEGRVRTFQINNNLEGLLRLEEEAYEEDSSLAYYYTKGKLDTLDATYEVTFNNPCNYSEEELINEYGDYFNERKAYRYYGLNENGYFLRKGNQIHLCHQEQNLATLLENPNPESDGLSLESSYYANTVTPDGTVFGRGELTITYGAKSVKKSEEAKKGILVEPLNIDTVCGEGSDRLIETISQKKINHSGYSWTGTSSQYSAKPLGETIYEERISDWNRYFFDLSQNDTYSDGSLIRIFGSNQHGVMIGTTTEYNDYQFIIRDIDNEAEDTSEKTGSIQSQLHWHRNGGSTELFDLNTYQGTPIYRTSTRVNNRNTIVLKAQVGTRRDNEPVTTLWLDQNAGHENDKEVNGSPNYKQVEWDESWGAQPPVNLNANMQGYDYNGNLWMNGQWR